jgi:uncharacterized membrane protein YphA (DoxX/SURF4 family)
MTSRFLTGRGLNLVLRLFLGGMFVYAAWDKVLHPQQFAISVRAYQIVPISLSNLFALAMSWSELVAGCLLIVGLFTRKAAAAIFIMLAMFTVAIAAVVLRGMVVDCGCFGSDGSSTGPLLLARNVLLMAAALLVMRFNDGFLGIDAAVVRPRRRAEDWR